MFDSKVILITGGTGVYGRMYTQKILSSYSPKKIIVYSRGELAQFEMQREFNHERMRYFIGDVRDYERLLDAMEGVDFVVHAAFMKQLEAAEYNPFECIKTNVLGAENVIKAAIKNNVKRVIAISVDKAAYPSGVNDATRLTSEKLFVAANNMVGRRDTRFSVVRYPTLVGSEDALVRLFENAALQCEGTKSVSLANFLSSVERGVEFALENFKRMQGGETFIPKLHVKASVDLISKDDIPEQNFCLNSASALSNIDPDLVLEFEDHYVICPTVQFANISDFTHNKLGEIGKLISYGRQDINQSDINSVVAVLRSDFLTQGPMGPVFEKKVATYCGARHAVAVNSATSALHIACLALGLGEGDWLWTSANTFVASANCGLYCGAKIDFVDIDPNTFNMSVEDLENKLILAKEEGLLPKIVIPVHFAGQSCEMHRIFELSQQYGFKIVEDASHAVGGKYKGSPIGGCQYADITIFSFHPVKIITTAEGGIATTNSDELAEKMCLLRSHGITRDQGQMAESSPGAWYYEQISLGFNYRMTEMQAALGISQMDRLDQFVIKRHKLKEVYDIKLQHLPLRIPYQHPDNLSAMHLYPVQVDLNQTDKSHAQIFAELRDYNIGVNVHYIPVYSQPYYKKMGFSKSNFPNTEDYYSKTISIPMYQGLSQEKQERVISVLTTVLAS